ncbi:SLC13 family permease [Nocardiopsis kunsanensis]|uniref:Sodium-dependent dicarboxylate transporter SdcS n=1 Tax=Nocardiopsis kunsanensis TaxID=141693 RepID=A0A918XCE9_9ACTN|nr:SLC13 family permease [Nocardiopsis kunsanensis]GHD25651.1 sodium-dependent dicarboxylate transporter SdcS [Nocardiopsis kunsanensis]
MTTSYLHSLWGNLWVSHRELKELLTFSWRRKAPRTELVKAGSGATGGPAADRADVRTSAAAESSQAAESPETPQESGAPGPGYTPARITGLILGPLLFLVTLAFFDPEGLSPEGRGVLASTLWVATWWITEAIPIPVTSLLPVALLPLTGAVDGDEVVAAYGDDIIFLFLGGFSLAIAMEKWNLHQRIALSIVSAIGTSPRRIILGFMVATGFLSMWVSNTAATMMMIPVGLAVVYQASRSLRGGEHASDLSKFEKSVVFGIGYAATIGGLGTLIGTPPLAILSATVGRIYGESIGFGTWMMFGVPIVVVLLAIAWFYLTGIKFKVGFKHLPGGEESIRGEKRALGTMSTEEKTVLGVFLAVAFMWVTRSFIWEGLVPGISDGVIAVVATVVLFTLPTSNREEKRILQWEDSKKIPWGILLLFGGGLAIAAGFVETGLSAWIGDQLRTLDGINVVLIIIVSAALVLFLTEITSNAATGTMILPVMAAFAVSLDIHPYALMVPCAMAANCAFMLPVGTPPNAIMFGTGRVSIMDMVKTGFWLNLIALFFVLLGVLFMLPAMWGIDLMSIPAGFQ